jgi:hypothetical protein
MKASTDYGKWMGAYASSTPGEMVPLQAADILAYELAKEFETLNKKTDRPMRWPLQQLLQMVDFPNNMIRLLDRKELLRVVKEAGFSCQTATDEVLANQMLSANEYLIKWMCDRGKVPLTPTAFDL